MITIITVGKQHAPYAREGIQRFETRLKKPFDAKWVLIPHSSHSGARAAEDESERIIKKLSDAAHVVLLDERGQQFTSPALAAKFEQVQTHGQTITCVIGGSYGVTDTLRQRADTIWSLSKLVFPHQLVRLILIEQLYRMQSIIRGEPYHHL